MSWGPVSLLLPSLVAISWLLAGCAIGTRGLIAGRVTHTETAKVIDVFTLGGWLRTESFDSGASLGYRSASYIYPNTERVPASQGWHLFSIPLPKEEPYCQGGALVGAAIHSRPRPGFTVGAARELLRIVPAGGEPWVVRFRYDPDDLTATVLEIDRSHSQKETP